LDFGTYATEEEPDIFPTEFKAIQARLFAKKENNRRE
jgi:hypothetical protein